MSRDNQFAGFAKALIERLIGDQIDLYATYSDPSINAMNKAWAEEWEEIVTHAAYDLATHVYEHTLGAITRDPALGLQSVPDLPKLPEEQDSNGEP